MSITYISCSCGNIQIRGNIIRKSKLVLSNTNRCQNLHFCKKKFILFNNSFEIQKCKQIKRFGPNCSCLNFECQRCGDYFFITCQEKLYLQQVIKLNTKSGNLNKANKIELNSKSEYLKQSKKIELNKKMELSEQNLKMKNDDCKINDDCDFELMFSNRYEPFVGSYKQEFWVSKDEMF